MGLMEDYNRIVENTKKYFADHGMKRAIIGMSGGVDSALTLKVIVDALGPSKVFALMMPERGLTKDSSTSDAKQYCDKLEVMNRTIFINDYISLYLGEAPDEGALMNVRSRVRATLLYVYANTLKGMVVGTSNKTEFLLGYFTKYGDGAVDIEVLGTLYKTEVWKLAKELGVPEAIVTKTPTAELKHGQTDEEELGMTYEEIDKQLISGEISEQLQKIIDSTEHKRSMPPVMQRS